MQRSPPARCRGEGYLLCALSLYGAGVVMTALQEEAPPYKEILPEDLVELWEERAAIHEYDGGLARAEAEWHAFLSVQGAQHAEAS